jgi:two-component system, OmpR family, phosphate regulon sensor histidine kinase PhoR
MLDRRILWAGAAAGAAAAVFGMADRPWIALAGAAAGAVCGWAAWSSRAESASDLAAPAPVRPDEGLAALAPLLEALPDPAMLIDREGRIAGSNAAARRDLKFEATGLFLSAILRHPDLLEAARGAAEDGAPRTVEYETSAHVEQHMRCYVAPITWGAARAALMVFHDQTARINTERMRADFLANASHELRTPLASVKLLLETISGPARDNAEDRDRFVRMMQAQANRMSRLIDDLLALSRIELDEHVPPSDRANLAEVASETADSLAMEAAQKSVTLNLVTPEGAAIVVGERFQLAQVMQNLVDNAIKYTREGSEVEIEVGLAESREQAVELAGRRWADSGRIALLTPAPSSERAYAYVRVVDSGPGVARRFLPRLGERFFRIERETGQARGGTGLGLAIVKHIVNRHRGGFVVESLPGKGSAFAAYFERERQSATTPGERVRV